jgi:hypothetical protein
MGEPVRILDLAKRMIQLSGYKPDVDIPITIVGARPGEKLDEELREPDEQVLTTYHPYINQLLPIAASTAQFAVDLERLDQAATVRDEEAVTGILFSFGTSRTAPVTEDHSPTGAHELAVLSSIRMTHASDQEHWATHSALSPRHVEQTRAAPTDPVPA